MKKIVACMTSAVLLAGLAGCEKQTDTISRQAHDPTGATMEVSIRNSYRAERILTEEDRGYTTIHAANKGILASDCISSEVDENDIMTYSYRVGVWNPETGELMHPVISEYEAVSSYVTDEGMEVLWMAFDSSDKGWQNYRYKLTTHDSDFNELSSQDVTDWFAEPSRFIDWTRDVQGNHYIVSISGAIELYNADGEYLGDFKGTLGKAWGLFSSPDGTIYAHNDQNTSFAELIPETQGMERLDIKELIGCKDFCDGSGEYDFYCFDAVSAYGVKVAEGSMEEIINWDSSDFSGRQGRTTVYKFQHCPDDSFVVFEQDGALDSSLFWHLTHRTDEEAEAVKLISIAAMERDDNLSRMVNWYNRQAEGHKLIWKDYYEILEAEGYDKAMDTLTHDLIGGTVPDILVLDSSDYSLNYEMFANKGMFEDLRPWMENDPDFHAENYYTNFFEAMEYKGELHRMSFWFMLDGILAKTENLNGKTALSLQDYIDINETLPEGRRLFYWNSQDSLLRWLCLETLQSYVDYDNAECSFDTPEFISLLKLCASAPESDGIVQEDDCYTDMAMFYYASINAGYTYHSYNTDFFHGTDLTLLAPPQKEGASSGGLFAPLGGTITMSSESFYKEEIWDFIKFCLEHNDISDDNGLPVSKAAMQAYIEYYLDPVPSDSENGVILTPEEAESLVAAVEAADTCVYWNYKIRNIITEAAGMCFAGDCTAEQAAESIQARVNLYLAEQNG